MAKCGVNKTNTKNSYWSNAKHNFFPFCLLSRQAITATAIKHAWAAIILQKHCRGFLVRRIYQLILVATVTIQAFTRGYQARKKYRKVCLSIATLANLHNWDNSLLTRTQLFAFMQFV